MYSKLPNLTIGFHGCNHETYKNVLIKHQPIKKSTNSYDWLGNGMYFWENNFQRALQWAQTKFGTDEACVIGAVIDLGNCLNLTDAKGIEFVKKGYEMLTLKCKLTNKQMPKNKNIKNNNDWLLRDLDCAVIQQIKEFNSYNDKYEPFDSVRGVFIEGNALYPTSGFREKTHIQICVINPNCIKGYFNPLTPDEKYPIP